MKRKIVAVATLVGITLSSMAISTHVYAQYTANDDYTYGIFTEIATDEDEITEDYIDDLYFQYNSPNPEATITTTFDDPHANARVVAGNLQFLKNIQATRLNHGQLRSNTVLNNIPGLTRIHVQITSSTSGDAATVGLGFFNNGRFFSAGSTTIRSNFGNLGVGLQGQFVVGVMHPFHGFIENPGSRELSATFAISKVR